MVLRKNIREAANLRWVMKQRLEDFLKSMQLLKSSQHLQIEGNARGKFSLSFNSLQKEDRSQFQKQFWCKVWQVIGPSTINDIIDASDRDMVLAWSNNTLRMVPWADDLPLKVIQRTLYHRWQSSSVG